jgi:hypothetical protein
MECVLMPSRLLACEQGTSRGVVFQTFQTPVVKNMQHLMQTAWSHGSNVGLPLDCSTRTISPTMHMSSFLSVKAPPQPRPIRESPLLSLPHPTIRLGSIAAALALRTMNSHT